MGGLRMKGKSVNEFVRCSDASRFDPGCQRQSALPSRKSELLQKWPAASSSSPLKPARHLAAKSLEIQCSLGGCGVDERWSDSFVTMRHDVA